MPKLRFDRTASVAWHSRWDMRSLVVFFVVVFAVYSAWSLGGAGRPQNYVENVVAFAARLFPPDFSVLPAAMRGIWETLKISVLATVLACVVSVPVAVLASRRALPAGLFFLAKFLLSMIRSVPSLVWAVLAVSVLGAGAQAGLAALSVYSVGYLGKFFSDSLDSADWTHARRLREMGVGCVASLRFGVWPQVSAQILSHVLWMLEYNIRAATILGYVGAGGIGLQLHTYQEFGQWAKFSTVLLVIFAVVVALELLGTHLRDKSSPEATAEMQSR